MSIKNNITVLISPLDWGLGHASRSIPLINYFLKLHCNVIIATSGKQENLLKTEFPTLSYVFLPGYDIQYTSNKRFFVLKIISQLPKILKAVQIENNWLRHFVEKNKIDLIVSDNRYGFFHQSVHSIFITHQLTIKNNFFFVERFLQKMNYNYINRFSECWVPDEKGMQNLAGKLSHPAALPKTPVTYIGGLSRFHFDENAIKYKLLIVLSGPEPQRTLLEKTMLDQLQQFTKPILFVRGLPGNTDNLPPQANIIFHNHLPASQLEQAFQQSEYIISRSGYTTVMDICKLKKKSILIPTPGQPEQEYLAGHLHKQGFCLSAKQENFDLDKELNNADGFNYKFSEFEMEKYKSVIEVLVEKMVAQQKQ